MNYPFVSIIIPCRNEEQYIARCLDSIIGQDYPRDKCEVLVVDGMSQDRTRDILHQYIEKYPFIRMLDNQQKIVPIALNQGIQNAYGEIIIRMDSHNVYKKEYIAECVITLLDKQVDNVGGLFITLPGKKTLVAEAIALGLSHPFGVGNAYFRIGIKEPKHVDTVPFGCYRKDIFQKIGFFDEDLVRNQDDEFNLRLIRNGGKILLLPDIFSYYYARETLSKLWKMYYQYGYFKPLVALKVGAVMTVRQLIPAFFVGSLMLTALLSLFSKTFFLLLLMTISLYLVVNLGFSLSIAVKKGMKYFLALPAVFTTLHVSYGFGYLCGIWDFLVCKKHKKEKRKDIPLTR